MDKTEYLKIIVYMLGCGGGLFICIGGLAGFIHRDHIKNSDRRFSENRDDHNEFNRKLDNKQDRRKK